MRRLLCQLLFVCLLLQFHSAAAAVTLCVQVETDDSLPGLRKLVLDELGHHSSHQVVAADCQSILRVELFRVVGATYLTARINSEVPIRFVIKQASELPDKLTEAVRQILGHDPSYLVADISRYNAAQRVALSLLKRGVNRYRIAVLGVVAATGQNPAFASGAAFEVTRGIDHWQIFARIWGVGSPAAAATDQRALHFLIGGDLGLLYEASARQTATFYFGPALGLFTMHLVAAQPQGAVTALKVDAALSVRFGLRMLRQHNFDFDLFAAGYLPLSNAQDIDSPLPKSYTPFAVLGLGVGF